MKTCYDKQLRHITMVTQKRTMECMMLYNATNALARGDSISTNALGDSISTNALHSNIFMVKGVS